MFRVRALVLNVQYGTVQYKQRSPWLFFRCPGLTFPICNKTLLVPPKSPKRYFAVQTFKQHEYKSPYRAQRVHRVQRAPDHHRPSFGPAMMTLYIATTSAQTASTLQCKPHYRTGLRPRKVRLSTLASHPLRGTTANPTRLGKYLAT